MILVVDMYIMLTMDLACMWNQKAIDNIKNFQDLNNSTRNKKEKGKRKTKQMEAFFFFFSQYRGKLYINIYTNI